jgi:GNAT superfamily N-acetyltransferase
MPAGDDRPVAGGISLEEGEQRLSAHLASWLGAWPPGGPEGLVVVGSERRVEPGWDGEVRPVAGVATTTGAVLSVPPAALDRTLALGSDLDVVGPRLAGVLDLPGWRFARGAFRWSHAPTPGDDVGEWLDPQDERVLPWLRPFNGDVLVALVDGEAAAGVGRKQHDRHGHELAVVTEEAHRGKGLAALLVAQAARRVLDDGAVPTYLHAPGNVASAATAVRAGFPDEGWQVLGLFGGPPG